MRIGRPRDLLNRARSQLDEGGDIATGILRGETRSAPEESNWLEEFGEEVGDVGAAVVNGAASFGNAAIHHPGTFLAGLGGAALAGVSAVGEVAGVTLDATGIGAIGGVPLSGLSSAGLATGIGITGTAVASMASEAAGDDHVEVVEGSDETLDEVTPTEEAAPSEVPQEITGRTVHGNEQAMGRDGGLGVTDEAMTDAVANPVEEPIKQQHPKGPTYRFVGEDATVVLNESGEVVSTWANHRTGIRNPQ